MEKVSQPHSATVFDLVVESGWNIGLLAEAMEKTVYSQTDHPSKFVVGRMDGFSNNIPNE